ncbi:uncharacterized protein [Haliotis cracherodii]|uniref:uncharacterized protein n=1 Tax=Haliotis cracherodii TaxID=6455 RepID=UPI0039EB5588
MTEDCRTSRVQHVHRRTRGTSQGEQRAGTCAWREAADDSSSGRDHEIEKDASSLLRFVNLVSRDIKTVLASPNRSKRVVDHRRYIQRQLSYLLKPGTETSLGAVGDPSLQTRRSCSVNNKWSSKDTTDQMTNTCSSKDRVSPLPEKYSFLLPPNPAGMNGFPTSSSSLPTSAKSHIDVRHLRPGFVDSGHFYASHEKSDVPLRQRHLPASFWKEPNVPKHQMVPGMLPFNWYQQGHEYKDFLDRLHIAQAHGLGAVGSRFPITEFLYYNYGMKNRMDAQATPFRDNLWPLGHPQQNKKHSLPTVPLTGGCPYIGCNCTNPNPESSHKGLECQGPVPPRLDLLQSSVWKPVPTKSLSSYPTRFHPFMHAR